MRVNLPPELGRLSPDPWPVYRTPWPLGRGPSCAGLAPGPCYLVRTWWAAGRGPWAVARVPGAWWRASWCAPWCAWCLVRGPRSWPPGGRSVAPGACALVAAGRGACAWWRAPGAWPPVPGPGPPAAGARPPGGVAGPKKRPRSRLTKALARFYAVSGGQNSFPVPRKQAPFAKTRFRLAIFRGTNTIRSMKTTCSKCGQPNDRLPQRYCRVCHAAYARATRPRHADLPPDQRQRANARAYANVYQRRGKITPEPCSMCRDPVAQKHHEDYSQPLQVRWLCRKCHLTVHTGDKTLHVKP
jgi:ribosomal protein S27AE